MAMPLRVPRYTVDQIRALPPDGLRYELLHGMLLVTPAPATLHQIVTLNLATALHRALAPSQRAWVVSCGELEIGTHTLLDPDILVYPGSYASTTPWKQIRNWWLAVEVLSRSTQIYDRDFKRSTYLDLGVETVWLVSPKSKTVEVWTEDSREAVSGGSLHWRPKALAGESIEIDLDSVFPRS